MSSVLITGASRGLGLELARCFARDGHDLVLVARSVDRLASAADRLTTDHGGRAVALAADLSDPGGPAAVADALAARGVNVDVLVNNAGAGLYGRFADTDLSRELALVQLNAASLVDLTKRLLPGMLARGRGTIVNVASTAAFQPGPLMAVYYASKAFVLSFSQALAVELAGTGVTVTTVCPGPMAGAFQAEAGIRGRRVLQGPLVMQPAAVAAIAYRAIRRRRAVVVPGLGNRLVALAARLAPRAVTARAVLAVNERLG